MIIGIGTDLIQIDRIQKVLDRQGTRFPRRILTPSEFDYFYEKKQGNIAWLAKRWAAKEAAAKAIGTGIGQGVSWQDFQITSDQNKRPFLEISGVALDVILQKTPKDAIIHPHISLTDDPPYAQAFIVIEARLSHLELKFKNEDL